MSTYGFSPREVLRTSWGPRFSPPEVLRTSWGPRFGSVVGGTMFPPRAPFFCVPGGTSRFPPLPLPHAHGAKVAS